MGGNEMRDAGHALEAVVRLAEQLEIEPDSQTK
jgi:hypothetical protein